MAKNLAFCTVHGIAFNRGFEAMCPQCTLARIPPTAYLAYDEDHQRPVDKDGKTLLDPLTLAPTGVTLP